VQFALRFLDQHFVRHREHTGLGRRETRQYQHKGHERQVTASILSKSSFHVRQA
jgi:hypothetical protein